MKFKIKLLKLKNLELKLTFHTIPNNLCFGNKFFRSGEEGRELTKTSEKWLLDKIIFTLRAFFFSEKTKRNWVRRKTKTTKHDIENLITIQNKEKKCYPNANSFSKILETCWKIKLINKLTICWNMQSQINKNEREMRWDLTSNLKQLLSKKKDI